MPAAWRASRPAADTSVAACRTAPAIASSGPGGSMLHVDHRRRLALGLGDGRRRASRLARGRRDPGRVAASTPAAAAHGVGNEPAAQGVALGAGVNAVVVEDPRRARRDSVPVHELHPGVVESEALHCGVHPLDGEAVVGRPQNGCDDEAAVAGRGARRLQIRVEGVGIARIVVRSHVEDDDGVLGAQPGAQRLEALVAAAALTVVRLDRHPAQLLLQVGARSDLQAVADHEHASAAVLGGRRRARQKHGRCASQNHRREFPHNRVRGLLRGRVHRLLGAHASPESMAAVHPARVIRVLRVGGLALGPAPDRVECGQHVRGPGDRALGVAGRAQARARPRGHVRPGATGHLQVLRLLRRRIQLPS